MAGPLSTLLDPSRINLQVRNARRTTALNEVARMLEDHPDMRNFHGFYQELLARERLDATCLGNEIALPHARTEHVGAIVVAVGRSESGVLFENANERVRLMFVLGTPKSNPGDYLKVVSSLCRLLKDPQHRDALLRAETPDDFIAAVAHAEQSAPAKA
jgi:mannitol/fructose-specific phosphotransferase system IIA component (Ntr-type)